jgi:uncharacterized spore protein YtfJ
VDLLERMQEAFTVRRVFGDPIERDGAVIIPVARVLGGGGGGEGTDTDSRQGSGGGFGASIAPTGVFVIKDGTVHWEPALDLNRVILGGQILAGMVLLIVRSWLKRRRG